jgi:hypothetical protein
MLKFIEFDCFDIEVVILNIIFVIRLDTKEIAIGIYLSGRAKKNGQTSDPSNVVMI